jgi:hypothetical protein
METTNDLHKWLRSNKSFKDGIAILENIDSGFRKMYLLKAGESSLTRSILQDRIQELAKAIPEVKAERKPKEITVSIPVNESKNRDYSKMPAELQEKMKRSGQILSEVNFIKGQLSNTEQSKRPPLIHKIMELHEERKIIWVQIDQHFNPIQKKVIEKQIQPKKRGMAPEAEDIDRRIKRLRQNISKNKDRTDRANELIEWKRKLDYLIWERNATKAQG